jgi:hypothetical protein
MMLIRWPFIRRRKHPELRTKPAVWWRPLGLQAREFVCAPWCDLSRAGNVAWVAWPNINLRPHWTVPRDANINFADADCHVVYRDEAGSRPLLLGTGPAVLNR